MIIKTNEIINNPKLEVGKEIKLNLKFGERELVFPRAYYKWFY